MGKRIRAHLCILLFFSGFLFPASTLPYMTAETVSLEEISESMKSPSLLSYRFIRVIRPRQDQWLLYTPSVTVFFQPDAVIFRSRLSSHTGYQIRLQWESPDPSNLKMILRADRLCYVNLLDGMDIEFYLNQRGNIEYDIVIRKKIPLEEIRFRLSGCTVQGSPTEITWNTPFHRVMEKVHSVYQAPDQSLVPYEVVMDSAQTYHYRIEYPESALFPIIVDPEIIFSTYIGGEEEIALESVTQDASGAIYACGSIQLPEISLTDGFLTESEKTNVDTIFLKIDSSGEKIFQTVIFGGEDGDELPADIALSVNEAVYIVGTTTSSDFPVTWNAIQPNYQGFGDAFCFVMNSQTEEILFSSYWGGSKSDHVNSLQVLPNGNAVLCGDTNSQNFPLKRPTQPFLEGLYDGFLSVIAIDKKQTEFSTLLGGKNQDSIECIAIQKGGEIVVAGTTQSPDFYTGGGKENLYQGGMDIFVTQFTPSYMIAGSNLFGGSNHDFPADLVCNQQKTYLIGTTLSQNFPITTEQSYHGHGTEDIFEGGDIVLMALQGTQLLQASCFGGSDDDVGVSIAIDEKEQIYLTGNTRSADLPTTHNAAKRVLLDSILPTEGMDGMIAKLDSSLQNIKYCSYWGGTGMDWMQDGSLYRDQMILLGNTDSEDFYTTMPAFQVEKTNAKESFLSGITLDYYLPSAPEDLRMVEDENGQRLSWSPSLPGEAPIQGYGIRIQEYETAGRRLLRSEEKTLAGADNTEYPLSQTEMVEGRHYYFTVYAYDSQNRQSKNSIEVCTLRQIKEIPSFTLAEYYDATLTEEPNESVLQYFSGLEKPNLNVLHYYPLRHPSNAIRCQSRWYQVCQKKWCLVNGTLLLTMQDSLEDTIRLMTAPVKTPAHTITWEQLSVPNEPDNQEVKISLQKANPTPRTEVESTVFLVKKINDTHWEVITSVKSLWHARQILLGEETASLTFYYRDIPEIAAITDRKAYSLVVLLQDPLDREMLAFAFLPLADSNRVEREP